MTLLQQIEEYTVSTVGTRREIANFILDNKLDIHKYSITDLAKLTFSSKSALVRFGKSLGFDGWKDFIYDLIEEIRYEQAHYSKVDPNIPFQQTDTYSEMIHNLATIQIESIKDTADKIKVPTLEKATNILSKSNRIILLGISPNNYLGEIFRRKMAALGKTVEIISSGEMGLITHSLTNNDCVILISYSGNDVFREPMSFIPLLKKKKIPIIAITSEGDNYIRQELSIVFTMSSRERLYKKISTFSTEESVLFILNILYSAVFKQDFQKNLNFKVKNSIILEESRLQNQVDLKE